MGLIADVRTGAYTKLVEVRDDNPTLIGDVSRARPASFNLGLPHAYVGDMRLNLAHVTNLRQTRDSELDVVLVGSAWDNEEVTELLDSAAQVVIDAFSDDPHFADSSGFAKVGEPVRVRSAVETGGEGTTYPAVVVTVGRITALEGR